MSRAVSTTRPALISTRCQSSTHIYNTTQVYLMCPKHYSKMIIAKNCVLNRKITYKTCISPATS